MVPPPWPLQDPRSRTTRLPGWRRYASFFRLVPLPSFALGVPSHVPLARVIVDSTTAACTHARSRSLSLPLFAFGVPGGCAVTMADAGLLLPGVTTTQPSNHHGARDSLCREACSSEHHWQPRWYWSHSNGLVLVPRPRYRTWSTSLCTRPRCPPVTRTPLASTTMDR